MTLELEKLTGHVEKMAEGAYRRQQANDQLLETLREKLRTNRRAWERIDNALEMALDHPQIDLKYYRSARPLDDGQPLDAAIPAPPPPETATVVASDGSQILPDRHAPYLYSLVNPRSRRRTRPSTIPAATSRTRKRSSTAEPSSTSAATWRRSSGW